MTTEKLSGSIWVSPLEWQHLKNRLSSSIDYVFEPDEYNPIELTITAKMPERKREFTESELLKLVMRVGEGGSYVECIDDAFKERE